MKYPTPADRAEPARIEACAQRLAEHLGWKPIARPELLPPPLRNYLYEPSADLILISSVNECLSNVLAGIRSVRCTALMVECGRRTDGRPTLYCVLIRCVRGREYTHAELRLWASETGDLFLVPDPDGTEPDGASYALRRCRIEPADAPFSNARDLERGLARAETMFLTERPQAVR
ncbi:hypothetical protein [Pacificimonas flava]|uniref:Uncharacterized protein n=1 Tax=Pacificimonas flava TaxID=1234595 RepID=M2U4K0_9SPHN|nr:hypothetical protein [Pacificimonas flava]EMD82898.1 hypothetical protein C725_1496 [Pacificimonas flava]MBB5280061.1 hypothetical protein [Pacificimonas flava]